MTPAARREDARIHARIVAVTLLFALHIPIGRVQAGPSGFSMPLAASDLPAGTITVKVVGRSIGDGIAGQRVRIFNADKPGHDPIAQQIVDRPGQSQGADDDVQREQDVARGRPRHFSH